ncbi:MAG TPA: FtsX-like permease family protein [Candidatus Elarobacter sp.]|nr:FtsX-like permease family protein [Candidatus Elarobacter sp.]HEV2738064.1 FtsX-like permease family protein [Candidatus Elarobacter sp.]
MNTLRDLASRPARTFFTVAGIAIGILALTVVGSLAERLHTIVTRSTSLNTDIVFANIQRSVLFSADARQTVQKAYAKLKTLDGVRTAIPEVVVPYSSGNATGRFGPPSLVFGFPDQARAFERGLLVVARGRAAAPREERVAMIGPDFAAAEHADVGDVIALQGNSFEVVGVLDKTFTVFDAAVVVPFADAQDLLRQDVPALLSSLPSDPVSAFLVAPKPGTDVGLLARRIALIDGLSARDPREVANTVRSTLGIFDAIVFGAALIALLVGAFSVINTMTIAVTERTREIGIRKAIGATDTSVLLTFVGEAATIGALGGIVGIALGLGVVAAIDARSAAGGNLQLFAISPLVGLGAFLFSVALSAVAGFVPALSAARLPPTVALRR